MQKMRMKPVMRRSKENEWKIISIENCHVAVKATLKNEPRNKEIELLAGMLGVDAMIFSTPGTKRWSVVVDGRVYHLDTTDIVVAWRFIRDHQTLKKRAQIA